ncbi:alcohol dehydrogenase catalytic domain-containing protein [Pseudomonas aeruginosa]|nr:alcohol dehydrogenase catalytic domain-containing protein [Pseudomonas aeruginosa]
MKSITKSTLANKIIFHDAVKPEPQAGEVRIRVIFSPIHHQDLFRIDLPPVSYMDAGTTLGSEAVGIVDALGPGVTTFRVGERVAGEGNFWSEYVTANEKEIFKIPSEIDDITAAQISSIPLTALTLIEFGNLKPGDTVLLNAASSTLARTFAKISREKNINTIKLARYTSAKRALLKEGFNCVIDTSDQNWESQVRSISSNIKMAIDNISGTEGGKLTELLEEGGLLACVGALSGSYISLPILSVIFNEIQIKGFHRSKFLAKLSENFRHIAMEEIINLACKGRIKFQTSDILHYSNVEDALRKARALPREKVLLDFRD